MSIPSRPACDSGNFVSFNFISTLVKYKCHITTYHIIIVVACHPITTQCVCRFRTYDYCNICNVCILIIGVFGWPTLQQGWFGRKMVILLWDCYILYIRPFLLLKGMSSPVYVIVIYCVIICLCFSFLCLCLNKIKFKFSCCFI